MSQKRVQGRAQRIESDCALSHDSQLLLPFTFMGDTDEQAASTAANGGLRQRVRRSPQQKSQKVLIEDANDAKEEIVWGKTPAGTGQCLFSSHLIHVLSLISSTTMDVHSLSRANDV